MSKMKTIVHLFAAAILVLGDNATADAQSECVDYHKYNCPRSADKRWSVNGQSKSAAIQVGRETELNIILYRGQDYRISVCQDVKLLGEQLAIRLVEKVREPREVEEVVTNLEPILDADGKPTGATREVRTTKKQQVFEEVEKVLWDNTEHDMAYEVEFSCASTKRIAITVIAAGAEAKSRRSSSEFDIGCAGILIEHMPTPGLGF
jgi:hypothetical protein